MYANVNEETRARGAVRASLEQFQKTRALLLFSFDLFFFHLLFL